MKLNKENQLALVIASSTLLTGLGPGNSNNPISLLFIITLGLISIFQKKQQNVSIGFKSILTIPLGILLIIYSIQGFIFMLYGFKTSYYIDRVLMLAIFYIYSTYLYQFSPKRLFSGSIKACLLILPIYYIELISTIISPSIVKNIRDIIGLRTVFTSKTFPLLGHHEPSHMVVTVLFILFTCLTITRLNEKNLNKKTTYLPILSTICFGYFSGTYVTLVFTAGIILLITLTAKSFKTYKFKYPNLKKISNITPITILIISITLIGSNYVINKVNIAATFDTSTVTRSYPIIRGANDLIRTKGLGSGAATYEKDTKAANESLTRNLLKDRKYKEIFNQGVNIRSINTAYERNDKIPFYSIIFMISSELGIIGFILMSLPFLFTIYQYFRTIMINKNIDKDIISGYFFAISSYLIMIGGAIRGSIIQWTILYLSFRLLQIKRYKFR